MAISDSSQRETTGNTSDGSPANLDNSVERCNDLIRPPSERISRYRNLAESSRCAKGSREASWSGTEKGGKNGDDDGLAECCSKRGEKLAEYPCTCQNHVLTQPKFPSQEPGRKAGRVHGPRCPQEEHGHLVMPWHMSLVLG